MRCDPRTGRRAPRARVFARRSAAAILLTLGVSTAAMGLPWDIDMADSQALDGYRLLMKGLPDGVVAQENVLTPTRFTPEYNRASPEGMALTAPFSATPEVLAEGERMYGIYCTPCHGDGVELGPVAEPGRFPGVVPLAGAAGVARMRTDGWIYNTIRYGGAVMPAYGWAMNDHEMWSIVHYVRTLPNAQHTPPRPATPTENGQ